MKDLNFSVNVQITTDNNSNVSNNWLLWCGCCVPGTVTEQEDVPTQCQSSEDQFPEDQLALGPFHGIHWHRLVAHIQLEGVQFVSNPTERGGEEPHESPLLTNWPLLSTL